MKRFFGVIFVLCFLVSCSAGGKAKMEEVPEPQPPSVAKVEANAPTAVKEEPEKEEGHSVGHKLLCYFPNRILDLLDVFRARVRVGPGVAVGVRATTVVKAYVGTYASLYAGLPGPRMRTVPRSPLGLESYNGMDVSLLEASFDGGVGPEYSPTEFGAGLQLLFVGFDLGIDPYEVLDFAAGLFTIDLREDDF